jgi:flagellar biosynthetic protein FlhB
MPAEDSDLERTEEPTARRLQQAREDGQVARSQELSAAFVVIAAMAFLYFTGGYLMKEIIALFAAGFQFDMRTLDTPTLMPVIFAKFTVQGFKLIIPVFVICMVIGVIASLVVGGYNFTWKAIAPKPNKINPLTGIKRIFGMNSVVELVKAVLKFSVVAGVLYLVLESQLQSYLTLATLPFEPAMAKAGDLLGYTALLVALGLLLIAAIDVPYQKHQHSEKMKMTKQEVKDEMKDVEGRPEVKAQIRRRQREMAAARMMDKVKDADVVVTNPEHFSVALAYDPAADGAPVVLAMGVDEMAFQIREEAKRHGVEVFAAPPLARALYFTSELDHPIHQDLYYSVAQVIAYVFSLRGARPGQTRERPVPKVPTNMQFDASGAAATVH